MYFLYYILIINHFLLFRRLDEKFEWQWNEIRFSRNSEREKSAEMRYLLSSILTRQIVKGRIVIQILFLYSTISISYSFVRRFDENCNNKIESELAWEEGRSWRYLSSILSACNVTKRIVRKRVIIQNSRLLYPFSLINYSLVRWPGEEL